MKKQYSKPEILFDSFELSQDIATCDCNGAAIGLTEFAAGECFKTPGPGDSFCYHNLTAGSTIFSS